MERLKHHALAVLFVLLAFGLTLALQAVTSRAYYILCVPAVMFAAWFGGLAAGITASIAGLLEAATVAPATKDRALGVITRQTDHLRRLVDDLLDLSRMRRNELQLRKANMDICEVVEDPRPALDDLRHVPDR